MSAAARTRGDRPAAPARTRAVQPRETRPAAQPGTARPAGRRPVGVVDVLRAELLRSRRTFTWGVVVATLALAAWAINLAHSLTAAGVVGTDARWGTASGVLAWMSNYPDMLAPALGTLVGAMTQWREQRIREGGTAWRGVAPGRIAIGRTAVLALSALACQLGWLVPVVGYGLASGVGWGPVGDYLGFALLMWVSVTGASLWGMLAVRLIGAGAVGLAPAAAAVWSIMGAARAEGPTWAIEPWTWTIRSTLPLLGVHGNGEKLEAGAAAWHYPLWPGLLFQIVVTGLALALVIATTGRGGDRIVRRPDLLQRLFRRTGPGADGEERAPGEGPAALREGPVTASRATGPDAGPTAASEPSAAPVPGSAEDREAPIARAEPRPAAGAPPVLAVGPGPRGAVRALAPVLPWRIWAALEALLLALVAVTRAVYSPSTAVSLLALAGVPVASAVVGISTWVCLRQAWRGLLMRAAPARLTAAALLAAWGFLSAALLAAWGAAAGGSQLLRTDPDLSAVTGKVYVAMVIPFVALMLLTAAFAIAQAFDVAASIVVSVLGLLAALVIAGNEVLVSMSSLWLSAPWGWASVAGSHPGLWLTVVGLSVLVALTALGASTASGRRVAVRSGE